MNPEKPPAPRRAGGSAAQRAAVAKEHLWPELEKLGEDKVRELLAMEIYRGETRFYVEEWQRYKEFPRAREALRAKPEKPGQATNKAAILVAATIAGAALLAHWALLA